jgi:hypothetical protein
MFAPEHLDVAVFGSGAGDLKVTSVTMRFSREQGPGLNSNSRAMSLRIANSYGSFLAQFDFAWYVTLTYATECSKGAARSKFKEYALDLERAAGTAIFWFCVDEIGVFGRCHQHALIGNVQHLSRAIWERRWRHGHARILCYDPGRDAAYYVTKDIAHPNCEFMLSDNIEAFRRRGSELHVVGSNEASDRGDDPLSGWQRPEAGEGGLANPQLGDKLNDLNPVGIAKSFPQPCSLERAWRKGMKMTKAKMALKGNGLAAGNGRDNLVKQARDLDQQIRAKRKEVDPPLIELGRLMARMRESELWKYLPIRYHGWEDYFNDVMGPRSRSTIHEIVAAYSLTQGSDPITPEDVSRMGVKRAAQLARLHPEDRTPATIRAATTETVMAVRNRVQAVLNQELPADEQKPMLKLLAINLPEDLVDDFEQLMEVLAYTDGARDGDQSLTIRAKSFKLILIGAQQHWAQELAEALKRMKAEAGVNDSPAACAKEDFQEEEAVPEPEELREFA